MRWNTCPPRDGGRRLRYRLGPSRGPVEGRAVEGGARGSNGGDGACARRGGAGAFPATLARGLPLAPGLKPRSYLRPSAFNLEPFAAFAGSILHFVFRSFGPGVRYKGVGVYSRLMPAPRAHASACTMVRLRSHDICSRLVASCGLLGVHAHGEAREHTFHASLVTRAS